MTLPMQLLICSSKNVALEFEHKQGTKPISTTTMLTKYILQMKIRILVTTTLDIRLILAPLSNKASLIKKPLIVIKIVGQISF